MRRLNASIIIALTLFNSGTIAVAQVADTPPLAKIIRLSDDVVPTRYGLDFIILPDQERFTGEARIDVTLAKPTREIIMHAQGQSVKSASVRSGNQVIAASLVEIDRSGTAKLLLSSVVPAGKALITIRYDAPFNAGLDGLYKVTDDKRPYIFTQMETTSARKAFPSFDEPRFKTPYDVRITVRENDVAVANAAERKVEKIGGGLKRITFGMTRPLPTYLFAIAVGDLDVVKGPDIPATKLRKEIIPLRGIATKGKGKDFNFALDNTAPLLLALEDYFGVPYPYEKLDLLAVPDFGFGAMENAGAIVYREQLMLLKPQARLSQKKSYGEVHAHELAHQWFGNLVTPYWWDDIWLNEAFASWMEAKPTTLWQPGWQFDLEIQRAAYGAMRTDAKLSTRKIREPILTEDDIANAFDGITYNKGAGVLNMVESYVGKEPFRKGVQIYMKRYPYANATSDQFFQSLAEGAGQPAVVDALKSFTDQPGLPVVDVAVSCVKRPTLTLTQKRYVSFGQTPPAQVWKIPLTMRTERKGKPTVLKLVLDAETKTIPLKSCPEVVMPDIGGFGYYRWTLSPQYWTALVQKSASLPTSEALSLAANLDAGFNAGTVDATQILTAARILAQHPSSVAATALVSRVEWMHEHAPDVATREKVESFARQTYGPLLNAIGLDATSALDRSNPPEAELRRERLVNVLAFTGKDALLRGELVKRAKLLVALTISDTGSIMPANVIDAALAVLAEEDPKSTDALLAKYKATRDGRERQSYLAALAKVQDDKQAAKVRALLKTKEIRGNEIEQVLYTRTGNEATQESGWTWMKQDIASLMPRFADDRRSRLPSVGSGYCSADAKADVAGFFTPARLQTMRGAARTLAQTLETIELCAALKTRQGPNLTAYFNTEGLAK